MTHEFIPYQECPNCVRKVPHVNCGPFSTKIFTCMYKDGHSGACKGIIEPVSVENHWNCGACGCSHKILNAAKECCPEVFRTGNKIEKDGRLERNEYFMKMTELIATRSTCKRKQVGALIVKDNRIISTGYNGSPRGLKHCIDSDCRVENEHCVRSIHAEMNALLFAGRDAEGAVLYCNVLPCQLCLKLAIQARITKIYYKEEYKTEDVKWLIEESDIELFKWKDD